MNIYYLSDTWPWFGKHQCYRRLVDYVKAIHQKTKEVRVKYNAIEYLLGKAYLFINRCFWRRDAIFAAAECEYIKKYLKSIKDKDIYHILFYDTHYPMFNRWQKTPKNVIATIHHPIGRKYPPFMEENLRRLSSAIVMYKKGVDYFERYIGKGRVRFIHYGVDTEFFYPSEEKIYNEKRLFFTGQNGRNIDMLKRVVLKLIKKYPEIKLDMLVPESIKHNDLKELTSYSAITWYHNLSENEVRELYQKSYLLLMPMQDSGVNNAVVEALACGLPIITTDVGGIRDYGAGGVYPLVGNNDDNAMIEYIEEYLSNPYLHGEISEKCRKFAEQNLSWPLIAQKHLEAYRELIK